MNDKSSIIFVHGFGGTGLELNWLRQHLQNLGYYSRQFHFPSRTMPLSEITAELYAFAKADVNKTVHFIGHSFGGVVITALFQQDYAVVMPPGRIITLGTPHNGCHAARQLSRFAVGRFILRERLKDAVFLDGGLPAPKNRQIGHIIGTKPRRFGVGRMIPGRLPKPGDGMVYLHEAVLAGATDILTLPVSHMGYLRSPEVVIQINHFLRHGQFLKPATGI